MARRKKREEASGGASWLTTYSDMVTLLMTFFILLMSMSTIQAEKWEVIVKAFSGEDKIAEQESNEPTGLDDLPGRGDDMESEVIEDTLELFNLLNGYIEEKSLTEEIDIIFDENYVFITFKSRTFFGGDSAKLKPESLKVLDFFVDAIDRSSNLIQEVKIMGHTADVSSFANHDLEFDRRLAADRANNVLLYIQGKNVIEPKKLIAMGLGMYHPVADNLTAEGRAQNRRVEILLLTSKHEQDLLDQIYNPAD